MNLPNPMYIQGIPYYRNESAAAVEPSYSVSELSKLSGFPASTIYDNIRRGDLKAVCPNGTAKGMRVLNSAWQEFIASKTTCSCS